MKDIRTLLFTSAAAVAGSFLMSGVALAQTTSTQSSAPHGWGPRGGMHRQMPGVFGTVASISGSTITITSKGWGQNATPTTYTVDASGATVTKNGAASSLSDIAVGDTVMAAGTVSGTSVTAIAIKDGLPRGPRGTWGKGGPGSALAQIQGTGQPVVGGSVTGISGSVLTVTSKAGPSYSVDASGATVVKGGATSTLANVAVGDNVIVQGSVNGSSVTATAVIDQGAPKAANTSTSGTGPNPGPMRRGFLGAIGAFLQKLFGFF